MSRDRERVEKYLEERQAIHHPEGPAFRWRIPEGRAVRAGWGIVLRRCELTPEQRKALPYGGGRDGDIVLHYVGGRDGWGDEADAQFICDLINEAWRKG